MAILAGIVKVDQVGIYQPNQILILALIETQDKSQQAFINHLNTT